MSEAATHVPSITGMEIHMHDLNGQMVRVGIRRGSRSLPPLLIFNGIGANLELAKPFIEALEDVEVVIFDIPGVGKSPAPMLPYRFSTLALMADKLMRRLGYDQEVDVLGISWGGGLAQEFAYLHPRRCRRLILAATSPGAIMVPGKLTVISQLVSPRRYSDPEYLQTIGGHIYGGEYRRNPSLLREHARHLNSQRSHGYFYQLLAGWGWTSVLWLGLLRQPTLVMHGNDDPLVPLTNAKILAARIPKARLYVIDDGHLFIVARAQEVAPVVDRFLSENPP